MLNYRVNGKKQEKQIFNKRTNVIFLYPFSTTFENSNLFMFVWRSSIQLLWTWYNLKWDILHSPKIALHYGILPVRNCIHFIKWTSDTRSLKIFANIYSINFRNIWAHFPSQSTDIMRIDSISVVFFLFLIERVCYSRRLGEFNYFYNIQQQTFTLSKYSMSSMSRR